MTSQIGKDPANTWQFDPQSTLMDLTRGTSTNNLTIKTTTHPIRLNTEKTALVIIDMQNFFLHPKLRRPGSEEPTLGEIAASKLLSTGIPAARSQGIQVIWLNWGLTEDDLRTMPPSVMRTFGSFLVDSVNSVPSESGMVRVKNPDLYKGLGTDIGTVDIEGHVQGGRLLMRDTWNSALYGTLNEEYQKHVETDKPDALIHKNRTSGLSGTGSDLETFLEQEGITTLLFAGVNTDQCVGSTLMDAYSKGYDCVLLRDATATGSPFGAQKAWEWNVANCLGFVTTCDALGSH